MLLFYGEKPNKTDFAFAFVALNDEFFKFFVFDSRVNDFVNCFGFIFRRDHGSAFWAGKISISVNLG